MDIVKPAWQEFQSHGPWALLSLALGKFMQQVTKEVDKQTF